MAAGGHVGDDGVTGIRRRLRDVNGDDRAGGLVRGRLLRLGCAGLRVAVAFERHLDGRKKIAAILRKNEPDRSVTDEKLGDDVVVCNCPAGTGLLHVDHRELAALLFGDESEAIVG